MTIDPYTIPTAWKARIKLFVGSALIFASMAAAGQAQGTYPHAIPPEQTADVVRPCTPLEISADIIAEDCGTLTLSEVVKRMHTLQGDDHDE